MPLCMLAGLCSCEDRYIADNGFSDGYTDSWDDSKFEDEESYDYKSEMQRAVNNALTIDAFYKNFCWYLDLMFYWNTYKELLKKLQDKLYSEGERSLYNSIVKMFRERESAAKSTFKYRVFVDVDNQRYYYGY